MKAGVAQGGFFSSVLLSLYVNDMPSPSHHIELALYAVDEAIIATSRKPTLLVSYLNDLQRWLSECKNAIDASKSTAIIFPRAGGRFIQPRPVTLRGTNRMGRQNSLSGCNHKYTTQLVASHRSGEEEDFSKDGYAGSSPE